MQYICSVLEIRIVILRELQIFVGNKNNENV